MPVPQVPRRAVPPRKKSSQKQTPAETEAIESSHEKATTIHDSSDVPSESQSVPVPVPSDVEPEIKATDPDADDVHLSDLADKNLELTEQSSDVVAPPVLSPEEESAPAPPRSISPPLDPRPDYLEDEVDPSRAQAPDDIAEHAVPSISTVSQVAQEETEVEEVEVPHDGNDEALVTAEEEGEDDTGGKQRIAEHVAKSGEDEPPYIGSGVVAVESHPATAASVALTESVPYGVFQQDGGATSVDEEDDGNNGKY
jgi:myosin tail region-interacting protein MTI1